MLYTGTVLVGRFRLIGSRSTAKLGAVLKVQNRCLCAFVRGARDHLLFASVAISNEQKDADAHGQNKDGSCGEANYGPSGITPLISKPSISDISKLPIAGRTMFYVLPNRIVERNLFCPERLKDFRRRGIRFVQDWDKPCAEARLSDHWPPSQHIISCDWLRFAIDPSLDDNGTALSLLTFQEPVRFPCNSNHDSAC